MTLDDAILEATGGPTVSEGLLQWYRDQGATSNNLQDAEMEWLKIRTVKDGTIDDMWFEFLDTAGYEGALPDMKLAYWIFQIPIPTP